LEEAPRFRDAQRLLLEIERESKKDTRLLNDAVLRAAISETPTVP
jgi:hypothetical protein